MKHEEMKERMLALFEGPLNEKERALVEEHLSNCLECRKTVEDYQRVAGRLFALPTYSEAQEDTFVAQVMTRVQAIGPVPVFTWKNTLRWTLPLVGSSMAALWLFFSALSSTGRLSTSTNVETAFSQDVSYASSSGNGIMLASYEP
jgi:anti-sigma factor RsiW